MGLTRGPRRPAGTVLLTSAQAEVMRTLEAGAQTLRSLPSGTVKALEARGMVALRFDPALQLVMVAVRPDRRAFVDARRP
jgi:hypothetical protein